MYHAAMPTTTFAADFRQNYPQHFRRPLSPPNRDIRSLKTVFQETTTAPPNSPIDAEKSLGSDANPHESQSSEYSASGESDDSPLPTLSARQYNRTKPQEVPKGTTDVSDTPTHPNSASSTKENIDPWLGWSLQAANARHHGISINQLKQFCKNEVHCDRLWEVITDAPELRSLLNIWWKIIDHEGETPTITLSLYHDIRRLQNLTDDCNHLIALIIASPNITKATIINRLGVITRVTRDLEYGLTGNNRKIAEVLAHRERLFQAVFLYIKDYNVDFWAGDIFYEAGCGPDPRDRESWHMSNGEWEDLGEEVREKVLGLSPEPTSD